MSDIRRAGIPSRSVSGRLIVAAVIFDWREKGNSTGFMPPLAQVGLHTSGELIAYINTLGVK